MTHPIIACVACLDPTRSIHTPTFIRAVELCRKHLSQDVELRYFDDKADATHACSVAKEIVSANAQTVVGHFASAAAAAAAPIYAQQNLPLFLPAATAAQLTLHRSTYRVCDSDEDYAEHAWRYCITQGLWPTSIEHDGSTHGISVTTALERLRKERPIDGRASWLFCGSYSNSVAFAAQLPASDKRPLIFTDDAHVPTLADEPALAGREVHVLGLSPQAAGPLADRLRYDYQVFSGTPGIYFWETVTALQVAIASLGMDPGAKRWTTVLGELRFGSDREARPNSFVGTRITQATSP